jgi:hypothetical protein
MGGGRAGTGSVLDARAHIVAQVQRVTAGCDIVCSMRMICGTYCAPDTARQHGLYADGLLVAPSTGPCQQGTLPAETLCRSAALNRLRTFTNHVVLALSLLAAVL